MRQPDGDLRGARHQARALREARLHPPAPLLQRAARADPGARAGADPRAARQRRAGVVQPGRVRRLLPARPLAARAVRRRPAADRAVPGRPLLRSATSSPSATRTGTRSTTSRRVAGVYRTQIEKLADAGITTLAALGRAPAEPVPAGINADTWAKNREQAELQLHARETGVDTFRLLQPQPEAGFALLPDPSPGDLFFDFEGNPFWDASGSLEYLWGILDVDGNFDAAPRARPRDRADAFETFVDLVHERLARYPDLHVYHYAQYEITALRRLMGRYGTREAELDDLLRRERLRRPLPRRPQRPPRLAAGLRAEGARGLPRLRAQGRDQGRRHLDRRSSSSGCRRATTRSCARSTSTTARTASRRGSCATGCSSGAPRRSRSSGRSRCPSRRSRSRSPEGRPARAELREQLLDAGEELAAQLLDYHDRERKPVWWAFFDRVEMTPEELVEDAESIGRLEPTGEP